MGGGKKREGKGERIHPVHFVYSSGVGPGGRGIDKKERRGEKKDTHQRSTQNLEFCPYRRRGWRKKKGEGGWPKIKVRTIMRWIFKKKGRKKRGREGGSWKRLHNL